MKPVQRVEAILGRMQILRRRYLSQGETGCIPFIHVYSLVTERLAYGLHYEDLIHNHEAIAELDEVFFSLYEGPVQEGKRPWDTYLDCVQTYDSPMLQVLMGIHTHINADLPVALSRVTYKEKEDFFAVNQILDATAPDVLSYLAEKKDLYGMMSTIYQKPFLREVDNLIIAWRTDVWDIYTATDFSDIQEIQNLWTATERMSEDLIPLIAQTPLSCPFTFLKKMRNIRLSHYIRQ